MNLIKYTAGIALLSGVASAQGLFDVNPNLLEREELPLRFTAGVSYGYDDNINTGNTSLTKDGSGYVKGSLAADLVVRGPRTNWDVNALIGETYYFNNGPAINDTLTNARLAFNFSHRLNNRMRFVSHEFINYGVDLGSPYGAVTSRRLDEYTYISTDNAIGYRWTERVATYTGITYSSLNYKGSVSDVESYGAYTTIRYRLSPQTVVKATYRFNKADYNTVSRDNHYITVGVEQELSQTSNVVADFGVQYRGDESNPFVNIQYANRLTGQLKARAFVRYSMEDTDTIFPGGRYDNKETFRIGAAVDYTVSPQLVITAGGSYTKADFTDGAPLPNGDWDLFNIYVGATLKINNALSLTGSINHTTSNASATIVGRDYDRNRVEVGVKYTF